MELYYIVFISIPLGGLFDIAFVIDASRSVGGDANFKLMIQVVKYIVKHFFVSQSVGTRFGVVLYDDFDGYLILDFKSTTSMGVVIQALDNIRYPTPQKLNPPVLTAFSHALILANEILFNVQYRAGASKYLIALSAGSSFPKAERPSKSLQRAGVDIYSIDLSTAGCDDLERIVSPVPSEHIMKTGYDKLVVVSSLLTRKLKRK